MPPLQSGALPLFTCSFFTPSLLPGSVPVRVSLISNSLCSGWEPLPPFRGFRECRPHPPEGLHWAGSLTGSSRGLRIGCQAGERGRSGPGSLELVPTPPPSRGCSYQGQPSPADVSWGKMEKATGYHLLGNSTLGTRGCKATGSLGTGPTSEGQGTSLAHTGMRRTW